MMLKLALFWLQHTVNTAWLSFSLKIPVLAIILAIIPFKGSTTGNVFSALGKCIFTWITASNKEQEWTLLCPMSWVLILPAFVLPFVRRQTRAQFLCFLFEELPPAFSGSTAKGIPTTFTLLYMLSEGEKTGDLWWLYSFQNIIQLRTIGLSTSTYWNLFWGNNWRYTHLHMQGYLWQHCLR